MKELLEYRIFLINRLGAAAGEFCEACELGDPSAKITEEWTLHQIAVHMRDVNQLVYDARVYKTLEQDNPLYENFDPEEWMAAHYDPNEPMRDILEQFKTKVDDLCLMLKDLPVEAWSRESRHDTIGDGLPLQMWVERSLAHIEEHLLDVKSRK